MRIDRRHFLEVVGVAGAAASLRGLVPALAEESTAPAPATQLDRLNNKRLKIGDVKADDADITAEIVTVDNSLVQRLKVNRRNGAIEYQN